MPTPSASTRRIDPGLLVSLLLATLAAWPLLTRSSLPTFTDAEMHAYRTYEILAAWRVAVVALDPVSHLARILRRRFRCCLRSWPGAFCTVPGGTASSPSESCAWDAPLPRAMRFKNV